MDNTPEIQKRAIVREFMEAYDDKRFEYAFAIMLANEPYFQGYMQQYARQYLTPGKKYGIFEEVYDPVQLHL